MLKCYRYYIGIAWAGQTLRVQRHEDTWTVSLPDGTQKTLPCKHLDPQPKTERKLRRPDAPTASFTTETNRLTRRANQNGQVAFDNRLYFVGIAHKGQTLTVAPTNAGLEIYTTEHAWITTCPWKESRQPDKPSCPM